MQCGCGVVPIVAVLFMVFGGLPQVDHGGGRHLGPASHVMLLPVFVLAFVLVAARAPFARAWRFFHRGGAQLAISAGGGAVLGGREVAVGGMEDPRTVRRPYKSMKQKKLVAKQAIAHGRFEVVTKRMQTMQNQLERFNFELAIRAESPVVATDSITQDQM